MTVSLAKSVAKVSVKRARKSKSVAPVNAFAHNGSMLHDAAHEGNETLIAANFVVVAPVAHDDDDVNAALDMLNAIDDVAPVEEKTLREVSLSFDDATVVAASEAVRASFERRDAFEASNGLAIFTDNSYTRERNRMLTNINAVTRLFLALGIEASDVIERQVSSTAMFNAKALKKITEIALYVSGYAHKLERVTRAFVACAIIATDRGVSLITNDTNRKFLCSAGFSGQITDQDLIDHLDDLRHRAMTSGAETQSSQARNVLDVLGLGTIKSVHKNRDAIELHTDSLFFAMFRKDFLK